MGDGVEPIFKGIAGTVVAGLVGLVHGAIDSKAQYAQGLHHLLTYGPIAGAAAYTASSRYGLWTPGSKVAGAVVTAGTAAAANGIGYVVGRVMGEGIEKLLEM